MCFCAHKAVCLVVLLGRNPAGKASVLKAAEHLIIRDHQCKQGALPVSSSPVGLSTVNA